MNTIPRTDGDGIDNTTFNKPYAEAIINLDVAAERSIKILKALRPVEPNSKIFYLTPKHTYTIKTVPNYFVRKQKDPKFVPYEPYKAAVEPMVYKKPVARSPKKGMKNDMDLQNLVGQLSETRKIAMAKPIDNDSVEEIDSTKLRIQWKKEKEEYETDIQNLRSSNSLLENQLKFQAQVNSELKTLLVAAVGEDLESRVQHLTADKLSLARELLNSANHLTSHQEQTEWLSGQCEVWRSKFLASSLMVEELAKWKSALTNRINDIQEVTKTLLNERKKIHSQLIEMFHDLNVITKQVAKEGCEAQTLKYGNILDVTSANVELVINLKKFLKIYEEKVDTYPFSQLQQTIAEKSAYRLLNNPVIISNKPDALYNAVLGAASSVGKEQMFLQYPSLHSCCAHCKGDLQNI